jgi:hypothetical protein
MSVTSDDEAGLVVTRSGSYARCYKCGDGAVDAVCSRCDRLLCATHAFSAGPLGPRAVLELFRDRAEAATDAEPATAEGAIDEGTPSTESAPASTSPEPERESEAAGGPAARDTVAKAPAGKTTPRKRDDPPPDRLGIRPRGSVHRRFCASCAPRTRPFDAELLAATTTAATGAAVLPVQSIVGWVLLGVGGLRVAARLVVGLRHRMQPAGRRRSTLALNPNLRKIKTKETISATVRLLPDSRWETTVDAAGSVAVEGNWSRIHRAAVDRRSHSRRPVPETVAAGHLVLHGPGRVTFRPPADARVNTGAALVLAPRIADQPLLSSDDGGGETRWHPTFHYDITPPEYGWRVPVWVSPTIAADLDRHVLELHVQWNTRGPEMGDLGVPIRAIEVLELSVPAHWGTVEHMTALGGDLYRGQPEPGTDGEPARRTLTWKKIPFKNGSSRDAVRLTVRFSERIDLDHELTGRIEARFEGAVSGLTRTAVYRTDGNWVPRLSGTRRPVTVADVRFTLSLTGLRYQEQRAIPDRGRAEDVGLRETETFLGVVPDHRTVSLLTNNLADEGYSIIRVQENPAQYSPRPGAMNRLWDLAGRYYEGVYPVEFHLQLSGEEVHKGQEISGNTVVALTVHGSYAGSEMERRVVEEWTRLWKRIGLSLAGAGDGPRLAEQPLDAASSELSRLRHVALSELDRLEAARSAGRIDLDLAAEMTSRINREFGLSGR